MVGAIIGDVVGSRWEFHPTNAYDFEWLSERNAFTDDTICTVAVADALIHGRGFRESVHDWCRRYPYPMGGYGGRFSRWVRSDDPQPYGSFGNGSAMRVSPVAYWFKDRDSVLEAARETAVITHDHPEGIKGAQTVALAIFRAMEFNRQGDQEAARHIDEILEECVRFSGYDLNMERRYVLNRFDETCRGTVPVALRIISMSRCFEDAIRLSVSLGADADTLGAIVGSIAEAVWGIPARMRTQIAHYLPQEMRQVIREFQSLRPRCLEQLVDTTFSDACFMESPLSTAETDHGSDVDGVALRRKEELLSMMAVRSEARNNW